MSDYTKEEMILANALTNWDQNVDHTTIDVDEGNPCDSAYAAPTARAFLKLQAENKELRQSLIRLTERCDDLLKRLERQESNPIHGADLNVDNVVDIIRACKQS